MYDRGNTPEYWDNYWSKPKSRYERYSMQRAVAEIRKSGAKSVLDVGCGNGRLLYEVRDLDCFGIDISHQAIAYMREKFGIQGSTISVYNLDNLNRKFDFVVCNHTLEHLERDREGLIKMKNRLNDGGTFFCAVPNNMSSPEETDLHCQMYDHVSLTKILTEIFGNCKISIIGNHLVGICKNENSK